MAHYDCWNVLVSFDRQRLLGLAANSSWANTSHIYRGGGGKGAAVRDAKTQSPKAHLTITTYKHIS